MKDKELKPIAKAVGADSISAYKGITLIALVITIIVMLILVGVSVSIAINGGLFSTAKKATAETQYQEDKEMLLSAVIGAIDNNAEVDYKELDENLPHGFKGTQGEYTSEAGNLFCVNKSGNIIKPITITVGTETVMLTPKNVGEYLGKVVTNYKKSDTETETITIGEKQYTVSTKYRLYYVDFDNKYKDGEGTIYLKAECTGNTTDNNSLQTTEPTEGDLVKIKELNPELYKNGNPPTSENMKAVTWLTNTKNWEGLKSNLDGIKESDINYVVGAPSVEMMMDSYNIHYNLTEKSLDTSVLDKNSNRVKLFYQYPYKGDSNNYGYGVGPSNDSSAKDGYYFYTTDYSVQENKELEEDIGTMYCPGNNTYSWLASPSAQISTCLMRINYDSGGRVGNDYYYGNEAFCPLVSLKSSVQLTLE